MRHRGLVIALAVVLVASRVRLVAVFGSAWTDEDQSLLWFAARDLLGGHLREPYFFGQTYGSWLEALLAVPMLAVGAGLRWALPLAASALGTLPWLLLAGVAWWRRRSALLAVGLLSTALAMAVEGTIVSTLPRGLLPGVVVGVVAAVLAVWSSEPRPSVGFAFGLLLVVGASWNVGSGLVSGPAAVYLVLAAVGGRRWSTLGALGGGLSVGAVAHVLAQRFYRSRPLYDLHPTPAFDFSMGRLGANGASLGRYLSAYAPEVWRWWGVPVVALLGVAVWVVWTRRSVPAAAAAVTTVALAVAVLGSGKAGDGTASLFFPWSRVYLGLPWAVGVLACLPKPVERGRSASPALGAVLAMAVAVVGIGSALVREVQLEDRTSALVASASGVPPVVPVATSDVARRCELRRRVAADHGVDVVIDRYDRTATYGCGALVAGDGITTFFPTYERRTWVLLESRRRREPAVLVSGLDACPPSSDADVRCFSLDGTERLFLVEGAARTVADWATLLGIPPRSD